MKTLIEVKDFAINNLVQILTDEGNVPVAVLEDIVIANYKEHHIDLLKFKDGKDLVTEIILLAYAEMLLGDEE